MAGMRLVSTFRVFPSFIGFERFSLMITFAELKAQLIEQGAPAEVADTVAASKLAEMMTRNTAQAAAERNAVQTGINADGLPCVLRKGKSGALLPCCPVPMVVLKPAAPSKTTGAEYGPSLKLHFTEHVSQWGKVEPKDHWVGGQSTASTEPPEVSGTWQLALLLSKSEGMRYFSLEKEGEPAVEMTAVEWLEEVQSQCTEFADDITAVRSSASDKPVKRRRS